MTTETHETNGETDPKATKHRWRFQYSLRTLMIFVTLMCVLFSWFSVKLQQARRQADAVASLEKLGGKVYYYHQWNEYVEEERRRGNEIDEYEYGFGLLYAVEGFIPVDVQPPGPSWLRRIFGDDLFRDVITVDTFDVGFVDDDYLEVECEAVVSKLQAFPAIRALILSSFMEIDDACFATVATLDSLECLRVSGKGATPYLAAGKYVRITGEGLSHLAQLQNLKVLELGGLRITDEDTRFLGQLHNLQVLELDDMAIGDGTLAHLSNAHNLKCLYLINTNITDEGLSHLRGLRNLETLWIDVADITDEGLEHLRHLKRLGSLSLDRTCVSGAGLRHLSGLAELKSLSLEHTFVTDDTLAELAALRSLRAISLGRNNSITGAVLAHLNELDNLRQIGICRTSISLTDLLKWKKLPDIERLIVSPGQFTDDELDTLRAAAPNLKITVWKEAWE